MAHLCDSCAGLQLKRTDFTSPPFEPEGKYHSEAHSGTFEHLRRNVSTCDLCRLIAHAIQRDHVEALDEARDDDRWGVVWHLSTNDFEPRQDLEDNDDEVDVQDLYGSALYPVFGADGRMGDYGIQLVDEKDTNGFLRGRVVEDEIDVERMKGWVRRCKDLHGRRCESFPDVFLHAQQRGSLRVINTEKMCLVMLPKEEQYIALSYVWGKPKDLVVTLLDNEGAFRQPGGLDIKLPRTIKDAFEVTQSLGLRYLWIDSLCITQDDLDRKQALIAMMDSVYANAVVTLVAATGTSADSGLSGWSKQEQRNQHLVDLGHGVRLGVLPYYQRELLECEHSKRAWTYQETSLSPRCLVFLNGFVYFNCNVAVYCEHAHTEFREIQPENSAGTLGKLDVSTTICSALQMYTLHVQAYTSRNLTYQSDGLNAFMGISWRLAMSMGLARMPVGLPSSCMDWVLLWDGKDLVRRREMECPSWAWAGWQGLVDMASLNHDDYEQMWLLKGTWINWYLAESGWCHVIWNTKVHGYVVSEKMKIAREKGWIGPRSAKERLSEDAKR